MYRVNQELAAMSDIIKEQGGIVDKFIGNRIIAVFTNDDAAQAMAAVRAGLRRQAVLTYSIESVQGQPEKGGGSENLISLPQPHQQTGRKLAVASIPALRD